MARKAGLPSPVSCYLEGKEVMMYGVAEKTRHPYYQASDSGQREGVAHYILTRNSERGEDRKGA